MPNTIKTPEDYINRLPKDRQPILTKLHQLIINNMPKELATGVANNTIAYYVPKHIYPNGYHCKPFPPLPFINLASQKNHIALYHMGLYADKNITEWFIEQYPKHCKYKLNMGKSCIRFKKPEDIPYQLIKQLLHKISVKQWIQLYETSIHHT